MSRNTAAKIACLLHVRDTIGIASMTDTDFGALTAIDKWFTDVNKRYEPADNAPARASVEFDARPAPAFEEPKPEEPGPDDTADDTQGALALDPEPPALRDNERSPTGQPFNRTPTPGTLNDGGSAILSTLPPGDNPQPTPSRDPDAALLPDEVGKFAAVFQPERVAPPITIPPQEAETLDTSAPEFDPSDPPPDYTQLARTA